MSQSALGAPLLLRQSTESNLQASLQDPSADHQEFAEILSFISTRIMNRAPGQPFQHSQSSLSSANQGPQGASNLSNLENQSDRPGQGRPGRFGGPDRPDRPDRPGRPEPQDRNGEKGEGSEMIQPPLLKQSSSYRSGGGRQGQGQGGFFLNKLPKGSKFTQFLKIPNDLFILVHGGKARVKEGKAMPRGPDTKITEEQITSLVHIPTESNLDLAIGDSSGTISYCSIVKSEKIRLKVIKSIQVLNSKVNQLVFIAESKSLYVAGESLIKIDSDFNTETIISCQINDLAQHNTNLAICSAEGVQILQTDAKIISTEIFDKVSINSESIAAGRLSLIRIWTHSGELLKDISTSFPIKSLKLAAGLDEVAGLDKVAGFFENGEVKIWHLKENYRAKTFAVISEIKDVSWEDNLEYLFFITSEVIDKFSLGSWNDEFSINVNKKIEKFANLGNGALWSSGEVLTYTDSRLQNLKEVSLEGRVDKIMQNSSSAFLLLSGQKIVKLVFPDLTTEALVLLTSDGQAPSDPAEDKQVKQDPVAVSITDFTLNDSTLIYSQSDSFAVIFNLLTNQITKKIDLNLRGRISSLANLQLFENFFYVSDEASFFQLTLENDSNSRQMVIIDWQCRINKAKMSPDQLIAIKTEPKPPADQSAQSSSNPNCFKVYTAGRQKFLKEFGFHSAPVSDFEFSQDNLYFFVVAEDGKLSLWSRETLSLITFVDWGKQVLFMNFGLGRMFLVFEDEVASVNDPVSGNCVQIFGPNPSYSYDFLSYIKKVVEHAGKDEATRINMSPYNAEMDKYIITPSLASPLHFYAWFQYYDSLNKSLQEGSSFHNTKQGINPLYLLLRRDEQEITIKVINTKCGEAESDPFAFGFVNQTTLFELNRRGYPGIENFYDSIYQPYTKIGLPKYSSTESNLPMVIYSNFPEPNKSQFLPASQYEEEKFPIVFYSSCIKVSMIPGSQESLNLLKSLADCPNQEVFTKPFIKILLNEKWKQVKWMMTAQGFIYLLYMICLMIFIICDSNTPEFSNTYPKIFLAIGQLINLLLAVYEVYQITQLKSEYFKDIWNYIDVIRFIAYTILMITALTSDPTTSNSDLIALLEVIVVMLTWIRGLTYFRLFDSIRYLTALIFEVMYDMLSFIIIAIYSLIGLSLMLYACNNSTKASSYYEFLGFTYMTTIGEYSSFDKDIKDFPSVAITIFTLTSIINTIVMMNLLISIMGDTFDRVQQGRNVTDFKELVSMIYEMETLLYWKKPENYKVYLQRLSIRYGSGEEVGVWEGRVRELMKVISNVKVDVKTSVMMLAKDKEDDDKASLDLQNRILQLEDKFASEMAEVKQTLSKICLKLQVS